MYPVTKMALPYAVGHKVPERVRPPRRIRFPAYQGCVCVGEATLAVPQALAPWRLGAGICFAEDARDVGRRVSKWVFERWVMERIVSKAWNTGSSGTRSVIAERVR